MLKTLTENILLGMKMINFFDKGDLNFNKLINLFIFSIGTTRLIIQVLISRYSKMP